MSVKVIKKTIKSAETTEIFNQMLGAGSLNFAICYPKYDNIRKYVRLVYDLLKVFYECKFVQTFPGVEDDLKSYKTFLDRSLEEIKRVFEYQLTEAEWKDGNITDERKKEFTDLYNDAKDSFLIHTYISICDRLVPYRSSLKIVEGETLNDRFILNMPGADFRPLPFTDLNFKLLISHIARNHDFDSERKLILLVLQKLLYQTHAMYLQYSKPDIDLDEFVKIIKENMKEAKKRIPRCDKAFKLIENSVNMLKDNFNEYYQDFIQSRNQSVIMENFIADVAKNTNADADTRRQFMEIIKHYRKMSANVRNTKQGHNVEKLFAAVESRFNDFGDMKNVQGIKNLDDPESDDTSDEEEVEEVELKPAEKEKSIAEIMGEIGVGGKPKKS